MLVLFNDVFLWHHNYPRCLLVPTRCAYRYTHLDKQL